MRISVVDLGSHAFHRLTVDVRAGECITIADTQVAIRIGERVPAGCAIPRSAFDRGGDALVRVLAQLGPEQPILIATGSFLQASNADRFLAEISARFGLDVRPVMPREAAALTYRAVCAEVLDPQARIAVIDLGGASLDCVLGERGRVEHTTSFALGSMQLSQQLLGHDMESRVERLVMRHTGTLLDQIRRCEPDELVLTSGTARALLPVARALGRIEPVVGCLSTPTIVALASRLARMNPSETAVVGVPAARCDTIAVGAAALATIVTRLGVPCVRVAAGGLREGLALQAAERAIQSSGPDANTSTVVSPRRASTAPSIAP